MNAQSRAANDVAFTVRTLRDPSADWDDFIAAFPDASVYLLSGWTLLTRGTFHHDVYFIEARGSDGALRGVLPIVRQKSLFGNFATSVAFFNYGGALSDDADVALALMNQARELAQSQGCNYLELRDAVKRDCDFKIRTDKVSMVLSLPDDFAQLSKSLGAKLRSQVKRADREAPSVRVGAAELLNDFYDVFAANMRDLGTPVYPRRFFAAILQRFPNLCRVLVVYNHGLPVAAGFLVIYNRVAEIPWAACRAEAKPLGFNMRLYWEVLTLAVAEKCNSFDFGRSTIDAGTYNFKKQWGAQPKQLYWYRWEKNPTKNSTDDSNATSGGLMQKAVSVWQRLPLRVANIVGPLISPHLPW